MHRAKAANKALIAGSLVIFFGCFALIRIHTTIGDTAFLRSMIPHHDPEACAGVHRDSVLLSGSGFLDTPERSRDRWRHPTARRSALPHSPSNRANTRAATKRRAPQNAKWFIPPCMKVPPRNP